MPSSLNIRTPDFRRWPQVQAPEATPADLARFLEHHPRTLILTGAGCSTGSGIPAYRDKEGKWVRRQPIQYQAFMSSSITRRRYWARSFLGWPRMLAAIPNSAHRALARIQAAGIGHALVTQNVDELHQRAGSRDVIELHGNLSEVVCQECGARTPRGLIQARLETLNSGWHARVRGINPDGDAELDDGAYEGFDISHCPSCEGIIKPDVVFFGENVPGHRVSSVTEQLGQADAVLVVGSSLVVWSGYRFVREAHRAGLPVVAVNQGRTRADDLLRFKVGRSCDRALSETLSLLTGNRLTP